MHCKAKYNIFQMALISGGYEQTRDKKYINVMDIEHNITF